MRERWCTSLACPLIHDTRASRCLVEKNNAQCAYQFGDECCSEPPHGGSPFCSGHCPSPCAYVNNAPACEGAEIRSNAPSEGSDPVNWPSHYRSVSAVTLKSGKRVDAGELEAIDVQDAFNLDRYLANVVKYCLRAGRKGPDVEDLKKARMYLDRKIARAERGE